MRLSCNQRDRQNLESINFTDLQDKQDIFGEHDAEHGGQFASWIRFVPFLARVPNEFEKKSIFKYILDQGP